MPLERDINIASLVQCLLHLLTCVRLRVRFSDVGLLSLVTFAADFEAAPVRLPVAPPVLRYRHPPGILRVKVVICNSVTTCKALTNLTSNILRSVLTYSLLTPRDFPNDASTWSLGSVYYFPFLNCIQNNTTHRAKNLARQTHQDKPDCEEERRERGMVEEGEEVAPPHGQ